MNFYAFRKIKYADTIRIDPKLEAETANYWRFRHEKFQRGKPELLSEIKRMNGQKQQQQSGKTESTNTVSTTSSAPIQPNADKENTALKSEVSNLKKRIEDMTKNIDVLTSMVQKVTLNAAQPQQHPIKVQQLIQQETVDPATHKRKKLLEPLSELPLPDEMLSDSKAMDLSEDVTPPSIPSPMHVSEDREVSNTSELSDDGFVDQLFTAFKTEEFEFDETESVLPINDKVMDNRPRPELMEKLSDALSLLPRDIQEMIVDRLIEAITSPKQIQESIFASKCLDTIKGTGAKALLPSTVPQSPEYKDQEEASKNPSIPLAAATLAALLSQYGQVQKGGKQQQQAHKTLPVIPVHA